MITLLLGNDRQLAIETIKSKHYTGSVPAGKSYYLSFEDAIVVWSIPANKNIAKFLLRGPGVAWELSRLYAPDGHERNLLSRAISASVAFIRKTEKVDILVSYADPNVGHSGGVYRAASWIFHGQCEKTRMYERDGTVVARRSFHSGRRSLTKAEIEGQGWRESYHEGKYRFVRPISRKAKKAIAHRVPKQPALCVDNHRLYLA